MVAEIKKIKEKLQRRQEEKIGKMMAYLEATNPIEIGVYGSFARGDYKANSDIDMYVLYNNLPPNIKKGEIYEEAADLGIDILVSEYGNFYTTQSIFCKNVLKDRKVLWKKEEGNESK